MVTRLTAMNTYEAVFTLSAMVSYGLSRQKWTPQTLQVVTTITNLYSFTVALSQAILVEVVLDL